MKVVISSDLHVNLEALNCLDRESAELQQFAKRSLLPLNIWVNRYRVDELKI